MERHGSFSVALQTIAWRHNCSQHAGDESASTEPPTRTLWASIAVENAPDGVWFGVDDENALTTSVELASDSGECTLGYAQSSRPVVLTCDALAALLKAQLVVSVYCGATRSRTGDELWGETRVAFMPAVLGDNLHETVAIPRTRSLRQVESIVLDVRIQCDADLSDFALGARVLRVHSLAVVNPPTEWLLPCTSDEEALRLCTATDRNMAVYELELPLPESYDSANETGREVVKLSGGRLQYEPGLGANEESNTAATTGAWFIRFSSAPIHRLFLKPAVTRLVDFLQVEKCVHVLLRRTNVEAAGRVTAVASLNLSALASPGEMQQQLDAPLRKISPLPKEVFEQELASASSSDEKKRLQAFINDYDAAAGQLVTILSGSVRSAKTRVQCVVEIVGDGPLVPKPPETPAFAKSIDELIPPRDLVDEYDQRKDVVQDLKTEIRRVVLTVLREYEDVDAALSRDEKRQRIVFRLNSQGAYHEFKEKLKKLVVPMIRDHFADVIAASEGSAESTHDKLQEDGTPFTGMNANKKAYFASVYATLMGEVHSVLQETFYGSSASTLEKTQSESHPRKDAKISLMLSELALKATENEVSGDVEKSENLHLDRIAFAEAHAVETPQAAATLSSSLATVWLDYAKFCIGQSEFDKAGGALRKCLALEPHSVDALVAYGALLCELQDFVSAEIVVKNALADAQVQTTNNLTGESDARRQLITAHGLLALFFAQSQSDKTGNLVLFELLKAQRALRQMSSEDDGVVDPDVSLSSVWIQLARVLHSLRLRSATQTTLQLADDYHHPRDVLSREDRVHKRVILAELLSLRGDGEQATALLQEALEIDRSHAFAWFVLGKTNLQLESQSQAAIECFQHSLQFKQQLDETQRLSLYVHLGLALLQSSHFATAKATFLSACDEFALASTWLGVGIASIRLEQRDSAQTALAEANRLDPTSPEVWGYIALLALSAQPRVTAQHEQRAKQSVAQALRYQLSNPVLLRELSSGFVAIDRLEDAERLLRRALVFSDSTLTRKTLADVLAAQNCAEAALAQYQQSLEESRDLMQRSELLENCAALLVTLGRPDEAAECRQMAIVFKSPEEAGLREPETVAELGSHDTE